jgi:hypothetical protein
MQGVTGEDVAGERVDQRLQRRRRRSDPAGQSRGLHPHPVAGEDLGLAIERQVIVIFRHDGVGKQSCSGAAAGSGAGAATTVSQARHDSFSRMCRTTLKRPGT